MPLSSRRSIARVQVQGVFLNLAAIKPFAQRIDDFDPIGVFFPCFAQKTSLGWIPEWRLPQTDAWIGDAVGIDKRFDRTIVVRQTELLEQMRKVFRTEIHWLIAYTLRYDRDYVYAYLVSPVLIPFDFA